MGIHQEVAQIACQEMKSIDGIAKLLLFGSVARNEEKANSDVDIAVILDNTLRGFPLDLEGFPTEVIDRTTQIAKSLHEKYGIKVEVCPFWEDQYQRGIRLYGTKYKRQDFLNGTGIVMYDFLQ